MGMGNLEHMAQNPDAPYWILERGVFTMVIKRGNRDKEEILAVFPQRVAAKILPGKKLLAPLGNYLYIMQLCGIEFCENK